MRALILGGHGFIGKNLSQYLKDHTSYKIFPLSRRDGLDLSDQKLILKFFKDIKPDIIFNCAAHVGGLHYVSGLPAEVLHDNLEMELNIYKTISLACLQTHVINPISNCAYPGEDNIFFEKNWLHGDVHPSVYPYGHAKRMLYVLSVCYAKQFNIKTTNLLIPNAFGPGDRQDPNKVHALNGMIIRMLHAWNKGLSSFDIWGTGKPIREWIYVEDVAKIMTWAAQSTRIGLEPINAAQSTGYSIKETAKMIAKSIGFKGRIQFNTSLQDGAPKKIMDNTIFKSIFPDFKFINHYEGISRTVSYYKSILFQPATQMQRPVINSMQ